MRAANITAGIAIAVWFGVALLGRNLVTSVVYQRALGFPNMGQINLLIVWPLFVTVALLVCAWVCNASRRSPGALGLLSAASLLAVLPYLMLWGGGV